jgi:endonuclease YncB( thermonuclease family)
MSKIALSVLVSMLVLQFITVGYGASSGEIDATAIATSVHDGDTFHIDREFHGSDTIRLADLNASELGQPLSVEARNFLSSLVYQKMVYLDIDDLYIFDYSGAGDRLVCVVYVDYNSTHYENVNKALLNAGLAEKKEYYNEFNSDTWTLYIPKTDLITEYPLFLIPPLFFIGTLFVVIIYRRKHRCVRWTAKSERADF